MTDPLKKDEKWPPSVCGKILPEANQIAVEFQPEQEKCGGAVVNTNVHKNPDVETVQPNTPVESIVDSSTPSLQPVHAHTVRAKLPKLESPVDGTGKICDCGVFINISELQVCSKNTLIKRTHIHELLNAQPVYSARDCGRLRVLFDKIETHYCGLEALGVDEATYSDIVVPAILEKMPEVVCLTITCDKLHSDWSVNDVVTALEKEIELREEYQTNRQERGRLE
ncbi:E3 ubiquitin- ligase DZIP3 [Paramuricea clavata]|uniref:E3 ubiquitin- ligase DZIP3 n=1 Tax=Paramuricea clavata TaxID=317549 RepID=A0A6S7GUT7_PARCT|nr:E3 ubiquitin- ligase DZIP3 [Paramuricea clavata]